MILSSFILTSVTKCLVWLCSLDRVTHNIQLAYSDRLPLLLTFSTYTLFYKEALMGVKSLHSIAKSVTGTWLVVTMAVVSMTKKHITIYGSSA